MDGKLFVIGLRSWNAIKTAMLLRTNGC